MKYLLSFLTLALSLFVASCDQVVSAVQKGPAEPGLPPGYTPAKSLLRVNATSQPYNFVRPWEKTNAISRNALGAVLEGGRVIVTAELVADNTYIELEKPDTGEKIPAKVVGVDYEANIALVGASEDGSKFFEGLEPLAIDLSTKVGDQLEVWQMESNGTPASTHATVIQIGIGNYFVEGSSFLKYVLRGSLQYREGSFTLPVLKGNKLAGILLSYDSKEQTSDIIPAPIIQHLLADLADGAYEGFPNVGLSYAPTLDEQLRKFMKIDTHEGGVYVRRVAEDGSANAAGIEVGDVILEFKGHKVDSRGNYDHPEYGKLNFSHIVRGDGHVNEKVPVKLIRNGELMDIEMTLLRKKPQDFLIDPYMFDRGPRYLILGGMIFQELTLPYLKAWGDKWTQRAPFRMIHAYAHQETYEEQGKQKLVVLTGVLRTPSTLGYEEIGNLIVTKVNDMEINKIQDLKTALKKPIDGIHKIEFDEFPKVIYVDDQMARAINEQFGPRLGVWQLERME